MAAPAVLLNTALLKTACISWFIPEVRQRLVSPLETTFPGFPLPSDVAAMQRCFGQIQQTLGNLQTEKVDLESVVQREWNADPNIAPLFKQILLLYRRSRAAHLEGIRAKTFDKDMANVIFQEIDDLDAVVNQEWFVNIQHKRLPRLKDFLPLQLVEDSSANPLHLPARAFDEKFRILYAPTLFFQDLAYFRFKCEARDTPVAIAFLDIDDFKRFNEKYSETVVDRSLLPRLMQTIEAHVQHHGYAYRQGGDEYLILLPNLSKPLTIAFLDELRCNVADLQYAGIEEKATLSIGLCIAEPDCPFTDRELLERANLAKKCAKKSKNCLATYQGPRLLSDELHVIDKQTNNPHSSAT